MNIQFLLKRLCVWMKLTVLCLNISSICASKRHSYFLFLPPYPSELPLVTSSPNLPSPIPTSSETSRPPELQSPSQNSDGPPAVSKSYNSLDSPSTPIQPMQNNPSLDPKPFFLNSPPTLTTSNANPYLYLQPLPSSTSNDQLTTSSLPPINLFNYLCILNSQDMVQLNSPYKQKPHLTNGFISLLLSLYQGQTPYFCDPSLLNVNSNAQPYVVSMSEPSPSYFPATHQYSSYPNPAEFSSPNAPLRYFSNLVSTVPQLPHFHYETASEPFSEPYAMSGDSPPSASLLDMCELECRGRKFRTYNESIPKKCVCINSDTVIAVVGAGMSCKKDCDFKCRTTHKAEFGHCDKKGFCYCVTTEKKKLIFGKCFIPPQLCRQKCKSLGYAQWSCLSDYCNCGNGSKIHSFNYATGPCAVPKEYCRQRCAKSRSFEGRCLYDECICTSGKTYYRFDLFPDESGCDICRRHCQQQNFEIARCIAGDCLCHTQNRFKVVDVLKKGEVCKFPTDFCFVHCAHMGFHSHAQCRNGNSCRCGHAGKSMVSNFAMDECNPPRKQVVENCRKKNFANGFCSRSSYLCTGW